MSNKNAPTGQAEPLLAGHPDLEQLSRQIRPQAGPALPEKVLQFGGGVFLRGFVEDFLDQAIRTGAFRGRVVIVQRERDRRWDAFRHQEGLYTLWLRGKIDGQLREEYRLLSSVSRVLATDVEWPLVLGIAGSEELEVVISNSTEVGYSPSPEDHWDASPPPSFPGKLTALLLERWRSGRDGLVIIPCELLERNGEKLRKAVLDLARSWQEKGQIAPEFLNWVERRNIFCSTLVDRIVTGPPAAEAAQQAWGVLGYRDELLITAEPYGLFAIEDGGGVRTRFPLDRAAPEVIYVDDSTPYWRRKLRLLNSPHTLLASLGLLRGYATVREALSDAKLRSYLEKTIFEEIIPSMGVAERAANEAYARKVLERFENPFVEHRLLNICFHCSAKTGVRLFPIISDFRKATGQLPRGVLRGIAGVLLLFREPERYVFQDANRGRLTALWTKDSLPSTPDQWIELAHQAMKDSSLWGGHSTDAGILCAPLADELASLAASGQGP